MKPEKYFTSVAKMSKTKHSSCKNLQNLPLIMLCFSRQGHFHELLARALCSLWLMTSLTKGNVLKQSMYSLPAPSNFTATHSLYAHRTSSHSILRSMWFVYNSMVATKANELNRCDLVLEISIIYQSFLYRLTYFFSFVQMSHGFLVPGFFQHNVTIVRQR